MPKKTLKDSAEITAVTGATPDSFELAMAELAQLVAQMEAGALPLEASVSAYRRGADLVRFCSAQLERVDQQVKLLEGDLLKPLTPAVSAGGIE